jgi:hypothetical protein
MTTIAVPATKPNLGGSTAAFLICIGEVDAAEPALGKGVPPTAVNRGGSSVTKAEFKKRAVENWKNKRWSFLLCEKNYQTYYFHIYRPAWRGLLVRRLMSIAG